MGIAAIVESLDLTQQQELLTLLMNKKRIAVHVESKSTTFDVTDVYDNSSANGILTILLVDEI